MKKIIFLILSIFGILNYSFANAENFYIKNYDIKLNVNENKIINITENLDVFFLENCHGIIRTIPLDNFITRNNGTKETLKSNLSNLYVSEEYSSSTYFANGLKTKEIKIGSPNQTISGDKHYALKYDYSLKKPKTLKNKDEFYFNIIGIDWTAQIQKVNFEVTMPKSFDKEKVGFSIGTYNTEGYNTQDLAYSINGNTIKGTVKRPLNNNEGLTIRIELPKDYFTYPSTINPAQKIFTFLAAILTFLSFIIWFFVGKDEEIIPVVNFKAPNLNSAVVGSFYRGKANDKDIVSLIFYLVSKGYITVDNNPRKNPAEDLNTLSNILGLDGLKFENYYLIKNKNYEGTDKFANSLMEILFFENDVVGLDQLAKSRIYYNFCLKFKSDLNKNCKTLYESGSIGCISKLIPVLSILLSLFCATYSLFDYDLFIFCEYGIFLIFPAVAIFQFCSSFKRNPVFISFWAILFGGIPLSMFFSQASLSFDYTTLISLTCFIVSTICLKEMPKKTLTARKLLGKILGFKKFLEVAEKHRIETLTKEDPSYCFNVLPYAYALDVSDEFIRKFEKYFKSQYWKGDISQTHINRFYNSCYSAIQPSVANGGISANSGGHSGGGHSGGGAGGGGGHSW